MMLDSALAFERMIKNPKVGALQSKGKVHVTWDNPAEVEKYIKKLQAAANKMSLDNRRLRKKHILMGEKVISFFPLC